MLFYKDEALVLRKKRFQDANEIICFFTRDQGRVNLVARGLRKKDRPDRFNGYLDVLSHVRLHGYQRYENGLGNLISCDTLSSFLGVRGSLAKVGQAWVIVEVLEKGFPEGLVSRESFDLARGILEFMDREDSKYILAYYLAAQLVLMGKRPWYKSASGADTYQNKVLDELVCCDISRIDELAIGQAARLQILDQLIFWMQEYLAGPIKTYRVYKQLRS